MSAARTSDLTDESTGVSIQLEGASFEVVSVCDGVGRLQQTSLYPEHVLSLSQPESFVIKSSPLSSTKVLQDSH